MPSCKGSAIYELYSHLVLRPAIELYYICHRAIIIRTHTWVDRGHDFVLYAIRRVGVIKDRAP